MSPRLLLTCLMAVCVFAVPMSATAGLACQAVTTDGCCCPSTDGNAGCQIQCADGQATEGRVFIISPVPLPRLDSTAATPTAFLGSHPSISAVGRCRAPADRTQRAPPEALYLLDCALRL